MTYARRYLVLIVLALALPLGGCAAAETEPKDPQAMKARATMLLHEGGVELDGRPQPYSSLAASLAAFEQFGALPAEGLDVAPDEGADALLFEVGTYDFGDQWGETMIVSLTRQYALEGGDIWQTNLAAHLPAEVWRQVRDHLSVRSCDFQETCSTRCVYGGENDISRIALGDACEVTSRAAGDKPGEQLESLLLWSYDSDRDTWAQSVRESAVFNAIVASRARVLGYELSHGSVE